MVVRKYIYSTYPFVVVELFVLEGDELFERSFDFCTDLNALAGFPFLRADLEVLLDKEELVLSEEPSVFWRKRIGTDTSLFLVNNMYM